MSKKKVIKKEPKPVYRCRYCEKEKTEDKFFKCSIQHKSFICQDCIKKKYNDLNARCEKHLAIFICCAILDIAFYWDIFRSLDIGQGIGYYVRQLNLVQNQNPDTFEDDINSTGYWYFTNPKYDSFRTICLDDDLIALLQRTKAKQEKAITYYDDLYVHNYMTEHKKVLNSCGNGEEIDLIIVRESGEFIQPRIMQHTSHIIHTKLDYVWIFS